MTGNYPFNYGQRYYGLMTDLRLNADFIFKFCKNERNALRRAKNGLYSQIDRRKESYEMGIYRLKCVNLQQIQLI